MEGDKLTKNKILFQILATNCNVTYWKKPRWGKAENEKLKVLVEKGESRGGINTKNLWRDCVKEVLETKFPEIKNGAKSYDNFSQTYRQKFMTTMLN